MPCCAPGPTRSRSTPASSRTQSSCSAAAASSAPSASWPRSTRSTSPAVNQVHLRAGTEPTGLDPAEHAKRAVELGAGEILLTLMDDYGMMDGYDLELIALVAQAVDVPVIACGGAGTPEHFVVEAVRAGAVCSSPLRASSTSRDIRRTTSGAICARPGSMSVSDEAAPPTPSPHPPTSPAGGRRIALNTIVNGASIVLTVAMAIPLTPFLINRLGADAYGVYVLGLSFTSIGGYLGIGEARASRGRRSATSRAARPGATGSRSARRSTRR